MIKRIVDISESAYIHLANSQLMIDKNGENVGKISVEDLGVLILQHPAIVITQAVIISCQKNNVAVVFCDERHLPYSILLPLCEGHSLHSKILRLQTSISSPTKKRLWQQIVIHKIGNQINTLKLANKDAKALSRLVNRVKSGDPENLEAQAARYYWSLLFGKKFRRDVNASGANALLNYGYAVIRAMTARAITSGGLHPTIGLHHCNQYNSLCLADDIMEPFRPWVDSLVYEIIEEDSLAIVQQSTKQILLGLISETVDWLDQSMPLMVSCHHLVANLKSAFADKSVKLVYPQKQ